MITMITFKIYNIRHRYSWSMGIPVGSVLAFHTIESLLKRSLNNEN